MLLEWIKRLFNGPQKQLEVKPVPQVAEKPRTVAEPAEVTMGFEVTQAQLLTLFPKISPENLVKLASGLRIVIEKYGINTPRRMAVFLAQTGHESGYYTRFEENLNYSADGLADTWPTRFKDKATEKPNALAISLHRKPQAIANSVYANRLGNGNAESGDGWNYRGRGPIQTTGLENYMVTGKAMGLNLKANPDLLADLKHGVEASAVFWKGKSIKVGNAILTLIQLSDLVKIDPKGKVSDEFTSVTKGVNGGTIGLDDRQELLRKAFKVFVV